jgi:hypothetical protein
LRKYRNANTVKIRYFIFVPSLNLATLAFNVFDVLAMENWDYYISGVWKMKAGEKEYITDVFLHSTRNGFGKGVRTSKDNVVQLLKDGARITTITWNYHLIQWRYGAQVEYEEKDGETTLHTPPDASTFDNLESAIQMQYLLSDQPAIV